MELLHIPHTIIYTNNDKALKNKLKSNQHKLMATIVLYIVCVTLCFAKNLQIFLVT